MLRIWKSIVIHRIFTFTVMVATGFIHCAWFESDPFHVEKIMSFGFVNHSWLWPNLDCSNHVKHFSQDCTMCDPTELELVYNCSPLVSM